MDGTFILVTETPNGESWNVYPAAYMNYGGGHPQLGQNPIGDVGWSAVCLSRLTGEGGDCPLPVRFKPLSITPVAWQPFPEPEPHNKLRKRLRQAFKFFETAIMPWRDK